MVSVRTPHLQLTSHTAKRPSHCLSLLIIFTIFVKILKPSISQYVPIYRVKYTFRNEKLIFINKLLLSRDDPQTKHSTPESRLQSIPPDEHLLYTKFPAGCTGSGVYCMGGGLAPRGVCCIPPSSKRLTGDPKLVGVGGFSCSSLVKLGLSP